MFYRFGLLFAIVFVACGKKGTAWVCVQHNEKCYVHIDGHDLQTSFLYPFTK
jgi:hypothetical protein